MTRFGYRVDLIRERHVRVKDHEAKIASRGTDQGRHLRGLGAVAPQNKKKKRKKKEKREKKKKKERKGTMNNEKLLKCCFFSNFSVVRWNWKIKKILAPKKKLK